MYFKTISVALNLKSLSLLQFPEYAEKGGLLEMWILREKIVEKKYEMKKRENRK